MRRLPPTLAMLALAMTLVAPAALAGPPPSDLFLDWLSGWSGEAGQTRAGLRIGFDPETGEWGHPTPRQILALAAGPRAAGPPRTYRLPDGSTVSILGEEATEYLVVRIGPDGSLVLDCLGQAAVGRPLEGASSRGAAPPER